MSSEVPPVDLPRRQVGPGKGRYRRQNIDQASWQMTDTTGWDPCWPAGDHRHPHAPFPGSTLALAEGTSAACMVTVSQPRAIIGGKDHQCIVIKTKRFQLRQNPPNGSVNLLYHVGVGSLPAAPVEGRRCVNRYVWHAVGQVKEETGVLLIADKP